MCAAFVRTVGVAVLLASGTAMADGFAWTAPTGCPTTADVRERIDRRLVDQSEIGDITVVVSRTRREFVAEIDMRALTVAGQGRRTLSDPRCEALADAVAVIVARLANDARSAKRREAPKLDTALAFADVPKPHRSELTAPSAKTSREHWNGGVRAMALSGIGMTPHVGIGGDLAVFVQRKNKFVEVGFARWVEQPMQIFPGDSGRVEFGTQLIALRGGWAATRMPLRAWGGIETGTMHGVGMALRGQDVTGRWVALAAGFGVGWPISPRSRLVGTFEVAAPLQRATFTFMDGTEISEPAPLSARCALGLEVTWQ